MQWTRSGFETLEEVAVIYFHISCPPLVEPTALTQVPTWPDDSRILATSAALEATAAIIVAVGVGVYARKKYDKNEKLNSPNVRTGHNNTIDPAEE